MHYKEHLKSMPITDEMMGRMWSDCREKFFQTQQGMQYKQRYEQLENEIDRLHYEMDAHISNFMRDSMK